MAAATRNVAHELADRLKSNTADIAEVRRLVDVLSKRVSGGDGSSLENRRKAMTDARGRAFYNNGRGGDSVDIMDVIDPHRTKALGSGFQDFLQNMAHAADPGRFNVRDVERVVKNLQDMGARPVHKTALAESAGATGGFVVPPQWGNELLRLAAERSFLRNLCRVVPMTNKTLYYPVLDQTKSPPAGGSAFFGGIAWTWQPEASNYQTNASTLPNFRQVLLDARDLVGIVISSNQLMQDNPIALDTILTTLFQESMGWQYDYFILQGNGANMPLGMLNSGCKIAVQKQSAGLFGLLDAANMLSQMVPSSWDRCVWMVHPSVIPQLISMVTNTTYGSFLVWLNASRGTGDGGPLANKIPGEILGRPMYVTEKLPKLASGSLGSVALVDPMSQLVGDRMAIQIEASPYPNFQTNQMTWRIIARWDSQPMMQAPIYLADGSYQVSPVVILQA